MVLIKDKKGRIVNRFDREPPGAGRPTKITDEIVKKLIYGFSRGYNDTECCAFCEISRTIYYAYIAEHPEFLEKVNEAKEKPFLKAKETIIENMDDPKISQWYLERRRKEEFGESKKVELAVSDKYDEMTADEKAKLIIEKSEGK